MDSNSPSTIDEAIPLLELLIRTYGPGGALVILIGVALAAFGFWAYQQWKQAREVSHLKERYDAEIERLAEQERMWRVFFFMKIEGWTREEAESLVVRNKFPDGPSARKALENEPPVKTPGRKEKKK